MVGVEVGGDDRPSAIWPWVAKGAGSAGGPWGLRRIRRDLIVLAASLAVFAGCAVIVADGRVSPAERAVFYAINGLPGWLYRPMLAAQYLGVLGMPLIIAAGALVWRRWRLAAALVLVVPLKLVLERVAKQLVQRQRPGTTVPDSILRGVPHRAELHLWARHHHLPIAGLLVLSCPAGRFALVLAHAGARVFLGRTTRWMWSAGRRSA